jgi:hypothetical protein
MAVSQYFNNYNSLAEQRIIEDIIVESIKIQGFDSYYCPNTNNQARDLLYGEDPVKKFGSAFSIEMYLSNSGEYLGEKEFFSKFGLEIKNQISVVMSKRSFNQRMPATLTRPLEGDLVYIPFLNGTGELYEIKFVNQTKDFFMLGRKFPYFYELEMEKFKYSQEILNTGVPDIDTIAADNAYSIPLTMGTGTGNYVGSEIVYQSLDGTYANATTVAIVQSWNLPNKTLTVTNISGTFTDNFHVYGQSSGANYILSTYNQLLPGTPKENYDNNFINTNAGSIIDFTESNPFGSI